MFRTSLTSCFCTILNQYLVGRMLVRPGCLAGDLAFDSNSVEL